MMTLARPAAIDGDPTMFCWFSEALQQRLAALEQERAEFIRLKQQLEAEFNQKRAKFKELYLSKEGMDDCWHLRMHPWTRGSGVAWESCEQRLSAGLSFLSYRGAEEADRSVRRNPGRAGLHPEPARSGPLRDRDHQGGGHGVREHQAGSHRPGTQPVARGGRLAASYHER